jgi:periplasmic protein TonB
MYAPHVREGVAPVRERLLATLFLAAIVHGIVILGLTFSASRGAGAGAPGLEVLLVSDEVPAAERNDSAAYLSQRTQFGAGTSPSADAPRRPAGDRAPAPPDEGPQSTHPENPGASGAERADERSVATSAHRTRVRYFAVTGESGAAGSVVLARLESAARAPGADPVEDVALRGPQRPELFVTPDTRESIVAPYLDAWRGKVERIGTLNYPAVARQRDRASPVLEIAIREDGELAEASIRRSSGHADLDQAALDILKLASPFERFPKPLAARYGVLRFAYEWQFVGGRLATGAVTAPAAGP